VAQEGLLALIERLLAGYPLPAVSAAQGIASG
jgi:hypothetical protein